MTKAEKSSLYEALGVLTYVQNAIQEYKSQGKNIHKIILGSLEWNLMGLDPIDDVYIEGVLISLNQNIEAGILVVETK
jgi:hypothetical protein